MRMRGAPDEAIAHYRSALALSPDYADAHFNLAAALARAGRSADAVTALAALSRPRRRESVGADTQTVWRSWSPPRHEAAGVARASPTSLALTPYRRRRPAVLRGRRSGGLPDGDLLWAGGGRALRGGPGPDLRAKGRPEAKPILVLVGSVAMVETGGRGIPPRRAS